MPNNRSRKQNIEFRQMEVGYVMERWRGSESCSLVGVGSVGKSNLLQHLADYAVQSYYMRDVADGAQFKAIIIDPAMLGVLPGTNTPENEPVRCWAGYELMMHRMFLAFYPFSELPQEDARIFFETYQALQDGKNPLYAYMGLRYFELGLEIFMKQGIQIVFMFDEFEELLKQMPVKFFLTLRGLRDVNKKQISYLTFTRSPLLDLLPRLDIDPLAIEPFTELFTDNAIFVGPYNEHDARMMLAELVKRNSSSYESYTLEFLMWATGRYAGLLRSGFRALETMGTIDANAVMTGSESLLHELAMKHSIRTECQTLWLSLSERERVMLKQLTNERPNISSNSLEAQQTFALLQQKQLVNVDGNKVSISPPVFRVFVKSQPTSS
jgi:hypothetical protein